MSCHFGLYFGNTNMCLAMHKDSQTEVLANAGGYRVTPSVIAFLNETEKVVGLDAKQAMHKNAANTITDIKDLLQNRGETDVNDFELKSPHKLNGKNGTKLDLEKNISLQYSISEILTILFTAMKEIARSHSHEDVYPTVLTVPISFTSTQRQQVKKAATDAGFQLLRIINEPAAAALAYGIGQESNDSNSKCLVFRMGGTSLDVTVLQVSNGMYTVLSTVQKKNFGGHHITDAIVNFCSSEFQRQYKVDIKENKRSLMKLRSAAEHYKHVVHSSINERCQAESVYDGIDLNISISKARFDSLIHNTLQQCLDPINEALNCASLSVANINKVILAGGSCKIPKLQQLISNTFYSANILSSINPDEVIAVGAAKQATLVSHSIEDENCFINLLSQDLSIKITGISDRPDYLLLCSKGTIIPTIITETFRVTEDTESIKVEILEGNPSVKDDEATSLIAVLTMSNLPVGEMHISFHIRSDGSIFVTCKDCASKDVGSATVVPPRNQGCT